MKFIQHYSSSKGNLYEIVSSNGQRLIIDPGVTWYMILKAINYDILNIVCCLLSHEHKDHSKSILEIQRAGILVYTSVETYDKIGNDYERNIYFVDDMYHFNVGDFQIRAFKINHDAANPLGFVINCDDEYLLFSPDTSHLTQRFNVPFDIIAIECSYDKAILQKRVETGDINETLARRLLTSHMEKSTTLRYLKEFCDLSKCRQIHLLHMSQDNIDAEKARQEFEKELFIETVIV